MTRTVSSTLLFLPRWLLFPRSLQETIWLLELQPLYLHLRNLDRKKEEKAAIGVYKVSFNGIPQKLAHNTHFTSHSGQDFSYKAKLSCKGAWKNVDRNVGFLLGSRKSSRDLGF